MTSIKSTVKEKPTINIKITDLTHPTDPNTDTLEIVLSGATAALRKKIKAEIVNAIEILAGAIPK